MLADDVRSNAGMRVIFFGTSSFAVPTLERLVKDGHAIVLCVTRPDRRQGRGLALEPSPVKAAALRLGVPLDQPERLRADSFAPLHPDVGVTAAFGALLRQDVLDVPTHGVFGVHPSLLPAYRGAAPVAWAILNGETTTGVTIYRLNEALDAGDVLSRQHAAIEPDEDAEALTKRLAAIGAKQLVAGLEALAAGRATFERQDDSQATVAPKLTKGQGRIDWQTSAETIVRVIRATAPWPGATTQWQGSPLKIWSASVASDRAPATTMPGTIIHVSAEGVAVATGTSTVLIREIQPAGRRRMSVKEFIAGHPVHVGEHFGGAGGGRQGAGEKNH